AYETQLLQVRQVRVHGRRRSEADGLPDVANGRRVAVPARVLLDEVEDLLLALRELQVDHLAPPFGRLIDAWTNRWSYKIGGRSDGIKADGGSRGRAYNRPPHTRLWRNW